MRFSISFPASPHCLPSPNGAYVATLSASTIHVRDVGSLRTVRDTTLPREFTCPVTSLQWSASSNLLLVASTDEILVFSALETQDFRATIRNPTPPAAKPVYVGFGASDTDVCVCASLGLKFAIFDLTSSKAVELANPKFHTAASARKGFCFRPGSRHLAVMTRTSGKDMISIHHPKTKELQRSWSPDTVDAQGIAWSPDGKWLVTWESAAHGHKVLFYTPDGNLFKCWSGPQSLVAADAETPLGPGVRQLEFSADARNLAIGDSSRRICIINMTSATESLRLQHPHSIAPTDTLQIWQEKLSNAGHEFVKALQTICPPTGQTGTVGPSPSGCAQMAFDSSSALLAIKLEDSPTTIWIWDISAAELRAVLLFHGNVHRVVWHPSVCETLLIACDGDAYHSVFFLWDPLSEGPRPVDVSKMLSGGKVQPLWLDIPALEPGALFVASDREYNLASLAEDDEGPWPWCSNGGTSNSMDNPQDSNNDDTDDEEASQLDDTFCFKKT